MISSNAFAKRVEAIDGLRPGLGGPFKPPFGLSGGELPLKFDHPDRSEAQWRDPQFNGTLWQEIP